MCDIFDTINNIDVDEPPWYVIGHVKCGHADALLEFVKDGKLAILNEIIDPKNVNFTFASSRGKSVIDYIINLHDYLQAIDMFNVDLVSDPMEKYDALRFLVSNYEPPDRSLSTAVVSCKIANENQEEIE